MSFSALKKASGKKSLEKLQQQAAQANKSNVDDRFWKPTLDSAGNGYAVIRFLPSKDINVSWTQYWHHAFKGPTGQWYIEKSLSTIGQDDPVMELNVKLWNSTDSKDAPERKQASRQKRRLNYISNIYIVNDPGNPENEGKVFLFRYGKKIYDMIMDAMQPEFEDEAPINPFDMWEGANFKLKIRKQDNFPNYDKSEFAGQSELGEDDEEREAIYNKVYDLSEFTDPATFKSYDELKAKMERVLGISSSRKSPSLAEQAQLGEEEEAPEPKRKEAPKRQALDPVEQDEDDDDSMSYFQKLAAEDD